MEIGQLGGHVVADEGDRGTGRRVVTAWVELDEPARAATAGHDAVAPALQHTAGIPDVALDHRTTLSPNASYAPSRPSNVSSGTPSASACETSIRSKGS